MKTFLVDLWDSIPSFQPFSVEYRMEYPPQCYHKTITGWKVLVVWTGTIPVVLSTTSNSAPPLLPGLNLLAIILLPLQLLWEIYEKYCSLCTFVILRDVPHQYDLHVLLTELVVFPYYDTPQGLVSMAYAQHQRGNAKEEYHRVERTIYSQ